MEVLFRPKLVYDDQSSNPIGGYFYLAAALIIFVDVNKTKNRTCVVGSVRFYQTAFKWQLFANNVLKTSET